MGHNAFRLREVGGVSVPRMVVTVLCLALISEGVSIPSLVILAILAGLMWRWSLSRRCDLGSSGASSVRNRTGAHDLLLRVRGRGILRCWK